MTEIQVLAQDLLISRTIMLTTILVAITSIAFSSITMAFERSHNVKSVRPFFNLHQEITDHTITLSIANAGLGPMIINQILLVNNSDLNQSGKPISEVLPANLNYDAVFNLADEYVLASKDQLKLFQYSENDQKTLANIANLKAKLGEYSISVEYQDVYEHRYQKKETLHF